MREELHCDIGESRSGLERIFCLKMASGNPGRIAAGVNICLVE